MVPHTPDCPHGGLRDAGHNERVLTDVFASFPPPTTLSCTGIVTH